MTYTNDFKADASLDADMSRKAQSILLLAAVQREVFCPASGVVLDVATAVLVIPSQGRMAVMDGKVWAERETELVAAMAAADVTFEVYDGRELV